MYFGLNCFFSKYIISEFVRYGLVGYRKLTGFLQLLGAVGLLSGCYYNALLLLLSSSGLFLLMLSGFVVRIVIKDSFKESFASFAFCVLSLLVAVKTFKDFF